MMLDKLSKLLHLLSVWTVCWTREEGSPPIPRMHHDHRAIVIIEAPEAEGRGITKFDPGNPRLLTVPYLSTMKLSVRDGEGKDRGGGGGGSPIGTFTAQVLESMKVLTWGHVEELGLASKDPEDIPAVVAIMLAVSAAYEADMKEVVIFRPNFAFTPKTKLELMDDLELDQLVDSVDKSGEWDVIQLRHGSYEGYLRAMQLYDQYVRGHRVVRRDVCFDDWKMQGSDAILMSRRGMEKLLTMFWPGFAQDKPLAMDAPDFTFDFRTYLGALSPKLLLYYTLPDVYISTWSLFTDMQRDATMQPSPNSEVNAARAVLRTMRREAFGTLRPDQSSPSFYGNNNTATLCHEQEGQSSSSSSSSTSPQGLSFLVFKRSYAQLENHIMSPRLKVAMHEVLTRLGALAPYLSSPLEAALRNFAETCMPRLIKGESQGGGEGLSPCYPIRLLFFHEGVVQVMSFNEGDRPWFENIHDNLRIWGGSPRPVFESLGAIGKHLEEQLQSTIQAIRQDRLVARQALLSCTLDAFSARWLRRNISTTTSTAKGPMMVTTCSGDEGKSFEVKDDDEGVANANAREKWRKVLSSSASASQQQQEHSMPQVSPQHQDLLSFSSSSSVSSLRNASSSSSSRQQQQQSPSPSLSQQDQQSPSSPQPHVAVFFHIGYLGPFWQEISNEILSAIQTSGLLEASRHVFITAIGSGPSEVFPATKRRGLDPKIIIDYASESPLLYEFPSVARLQAYCSHHPDALVYYMHNKGASRATRTVAAYASSVAWGRYMTYFVVNQYYHCLSALTDYKYDVCGTEYNAGYNLYQGNFWAARCQHINRLPDLPSSDLLRRHWAESWILSTNETCRIWSCGDAGLDLYHNVIEPSYYQDWDCSPGGSSNGKKQGGKGVGHTFWNRKGLYEYKSKH